MTTIEINENNYNDSDPSGRNRNTIESHTTSGSTNHNNESSGHTSISIGGEKNGDGSPSIT